MLTFKQVPEEMVNPELIYEISKHHRLVPENPASAIASYKSIAAAGIVGAVLDDEDAIATVIVSNLMPGECADLDIILVSKHFRRPKARSEELRHALAPLLRVLFNEHHVRRLSSFTPVSRRRSIAAFEALGFAHEGVVRSGVAIEGEEPEDLVMMGLLANDFEVNHVLP